MKNTLIKLQAYELQEFLDMHSMEQLLDKLPDLGLYYADKFNLIYKGHDDILIELIPILESLGFEMYRESIKVLFAFKNDVSIRFNVIKAPKLSTLGLSIRTSIPDGPAKFKNLIIKKCGIEILETNVFELNWYFMAKGDLNYSYLKEVANDVLLDEAYPEIKQGIEAYVNDYLDSDESVLILSGPPGTGKTRLIRHILGTMSNRMGRPSRSIYTGDNDVFKNENVFIQFVTEENNAFVIEDADFLLDKRSDGNMIMHNFLKATDGLISSQGRKMIFSVNLHKKGSIDDALMRPGRCYDVLNVRNLTMEEAEKVAELICKNLNKEPKKLPFNKNYSLAEIYKQLK